MLRSFQNIANPTNTLPLTPKYDKNICAKKVDYTKKPDDSLKTKAPGYNFINFWILFVRCQKADIRTLKAEIRIFHSFILSSRQYDETFFHLLS
jgi:hypothetical protein